MQHRFDVCRRRAQRSEVATLLLLMHFGSVVRAETAAYPETGGPWVTAPVHAPGLQFRTFESKAAASKVSYHIYTPPAYANESQRRFPVLYWLHGGGGGQKGMAPVVRHFASAMREGKVPPMLIVFPNGLKLSLWVDSKDGAVPMETVVVKELIPEVDAHFRTLTRREGRMVEGFSMGGYGAARLGFKHHDMFRAVSILSGGPLQQEFTETPRATAWMRERAFQSVFGSDMAYYKAVSPWSLAEQNAAALRDKLLVRMAIGERDEMLEVTRRFEQHLTKLGIPHQFTVLPGVGHNPPRVVSALAGEESYWAFYRTAFSPASRRD